MEYSNRQSTRRIRADLALLLVSIIWGSAFVAQRVAASSGSIFFFNGLRFLIAASVLLPIAWLQSRKHPEHAPLGRKAWGGVILAGLLLTGGAGLQQAGLRFTTAGNAGFITGLYVVLIPIIQAVFLHQAPRRTIWLAAIMAVSGLFLLSTSGQFGFRLGDALELGGAVFWAFHVIWIGNLVISLGALQIAAGQYLICGIVSTILGLIVEPAQTGNLMNVAWAILYTGLISVGLGYTLQIYGQKIAPPADAAILLSMEAVFAALFGWLLLGETLNSTQVLGCGIMLGGMLLAQASAFRSREPVPENISV